MPTFTLKVEMTDAQLKKGNGDFTMTLIGTIEYVRAQAHTMFFRNPALRRMYYGCAVYKGGKLIGGLHPSRDEGGRIIYVWSEPPYNLKSPVYKVDPKTGIIIGRLYRCQITGRSSMPTLGTQRMKPIPITDAPWIRP